jgi:hypothetical protein
MLLAVVGQAAAARPPGSAILYSGLTGPGPNATTHVVTDTEALHEGKSGVHLWLRFIRGRAVINLDRPFRCVFPPGVRALLNRAAEPHDFVVTTTCHEKDGSAPLIVIRSDHYLAAARASDKLQTALDQLTRPESVYPFFVEDVDNRGVPYYEAFHFDHADGGWARADALYRVHPP